MDQTFLQTASASLRTGNIIVDMAVAGFLGLIVSMFLSKGHVLWEHIVKWCIGITNTAITPYKYSFIIKTNALKVGSNTGNKFMGINSENTILINGIIRDLMVSGGNEHVKTQEVMNLLGDGDLCKRDRNIASVISSFPQSEILFQDMLFEFENKSAINTEEKEPSVTESKKITIWSNNRKKTNEYFTKCKLAEIDRVFPESPVEEFRPYYWFISSPPTAETGRYLFTRYPWHSGKCFDSLFFSRKAEIIQTINHFQNATGPWDIIRQRSHTCNIFLWGRPGGGKTSIVKAIANMTGRHIFGISMLRIKTDEDLMSIVSSEKLCYTSMRGGYEDNERVPLNKRIYLLEDLDCSGCEHIIAPRSKVDSEPIIDQKLRIDVKNKDMWTTNDTSLSGFLNALNGICELTGAMFIISTNHKEKFDPAIYRPGRMDIDLEMSEMTAIDICEFLKRYYNTELSQVIQNRVQLADKLHMPCKIEQICQIHHTAEDAANAL